MAGNAIQDDFRASKSEMYCMYTFRGYTPVFVL